jgi:hypothetical protein
MKKAKYSKLTLFELAFVFIFISAISCKNAQAVKDTHVELISDLSKQTALFQGLADIAKNKLSEPGLNDSISFLVLPVQRCCASCRKKTIDSIVKYQDKLDQDCFVIISANGGRKTINAFFREQQYELPLGTAIVLDTTDAALEKQLYTDNPAFYYAFNRKIYKKVAALPITIKQDLSEFFNQ